MTAVKICSKSVCLTQILVGKAGVSMVPAAVEVLGDRTELDDQIVCRSSGDLAALLPPQADEFGFITAHDDARIGAADEGAAVLLVESDRDVLVELVEVASLVPLRCTLLAGISFEVQAALSAALPRPRPNTPPGGA